MDLPAALAKKIVCGRTVEQLLEEIKAFHTHLAPGMVVGAFYVLKIDADEVHEDDAAPILATVLAGEGVYWDEPPSEGKIELKAAWDGVLKVNVEALLKFNLIPDVMAATLHTNTPV